MLAGVVVLEVLVELLLVLRVATMGTGVPLAPLLVWWLILWTSVTPDRGVGTRAPASVPGTMAMKVHRSPLVHRSLLPAVTLRIVWRGDGQLPILGIVLCLMDLAETTALMQCFEGDAHRL